MANVSLPKSTPLQSVSTVVKTPTSTSTTSPSSTTASSSTTSSAPTSLKPTITKRDLNLRKQREDIYANVAQVNSLRQELGEVTVSGNMGRAKEIMKELAKLTPPFLDHTKVGKTVSEAPQVSTSSSLLRTVAIDSVAILKDPEIHAAVDQMISERETEYNGLKGSLPGLESSLADKRLSLAVLVDGNSELNASYDQRSPHKLTELRSELTQQRQELEDIQGPMTEKQSELSGKTTQLTTKQDELTAKTTELTDKQALLASKKEQLAQFKSGNPSLRDQLQQDITRLQSEIDPLQGRVTRLQSEIGTIKGEITALKETLKPMEAIKKNVARLNYTIKRAELESSIANLGSQVGHIKNLASEITTLKTAKKGTLWETVKKAYIGGVTSTSKLAMVVALDARLQEINTKMKAVGQSFKPPIPVVLPGEDAPKPPFIKIQICGSAELSSDIDVNVTAVGCPTGTDTKFVKQFNIDYRAAHGDESGNDLDVNLYTEGVFPDFMKEIKDGGPFPWTTEAAKENNKSQDIVALVKVRKFMDNDTEWNKMVDDIVAQAPAEQRDAIRAQYTAANDFVRGADIEIASEIAKLKSNPEYAGKNDSELALIANNRLYEKYSVEADKFKAEFDVSGDQSQLARSHFELGKAHYFANEAALSEGVLRRVVVNEQAIAGINKGRKDIGKDISSREKEITQQKELLETLDPDSGVAAETRKKIGVLEGEIEYLKTLPTEQLPIVDISPSQMLQSFNENFGDIIKEIHHHGGSLEEAAYRSSKYLGRMCRDIEGMLELTGKKDDPAFAGILAMVEKFGIAEGYKADPEKGLLAIRKDKLDKSKAPEILANAGWDFASVSDFRTAIINLSNEFNAKIRPMI